MPLDGESAPANAVYPFFGFRQFLAGATVTGDTDVSVELGHDTRFGFVRPTMPPPGNYQLMFLSNCADGTQRGGFQNFQIEPEAPLPTSLGVLRLSAPEVTEVALDAGGPCSANAIAVGSQVWVELDPTAGPWQGVLVYSTIVDGNPYAPQHTAGATPDPTSGAYAGGSWRGRGRDLVVTVCREPTYDVWGDVAEGAHRVKMQARLAGTNLVLETSEIEIDLRCPDPELAPEMPAGSCSAGGTHTTANLLVVLVGMMRLRRRHRSSHR